MGGSRRVPAPSQLGLDYRLGHDVVPKVLSYGGGLDSFCMLIESVRRGEKPDVVVFVDVGDPKDRSVPAEWPGTYRHLQDYAVPFCVEHEIEFVWIGPDEYPVRDARSLFEWMETRRQIPVAGPKRLCTTIAKVERFEAWMGDRFPGREVEVWIGFEAGEEARAANDPNAGTGTPGKTGAARRNKFLLIEWGFCRCRAELAVREAGFPVPRKSACVACPYSTRGDFQSLAEELPDLFAKVVKLEADKPPTKKGFKLSIKDFRKKKDADGNVVGYSAPPLTEIIKRPYKQKRQNCRVCGAAQRASKATGCGYLT